MEDMVLANKTVEHLVQEQSEYTVIMIDIDGYFHLLPEKGNETI